MKKVVFILMLLGLTGCPRGEGRFRDPDKPLKVIQNGSNRDEDCVLDASCLRQEHSHQNHILQHPNLVCQSSH